MTNPFKVLSEIGFSDEEISMLKSLIALHKNDEDKIAASCFVAGYNYAAEQSLINVSKVSKKLRQVCDDEG